MQKCESSNCVIAAVIDELGIIFISLFLLSSVVLMHMPVSGQSRDFED